MPGASLQRFIFHRFFTDLGEGEGLYIAALSRDETDLRWLADELNQVVSETLRPEWVDLWLRPREMD